MSQEFEPACRRMEWLDPFYRKIWEKAFADATPISGTFELTPRCNFDCRMCYVHLKQECISQYGTELTAKEWIRIAEEAKDAGTIWLCVTGGEPLMHPEFDIIWKEITQMGFFITLQTNASLIDGKYLRLLEQYPPRTVKTTLYGSNDRVYEAVCRIKDGFTRVDRGLRNLKNLGIPVELVTTVIRQNLDDIPGIIQYVSSNKYAWRGTGSIKDSCRGADSQARSVRVQEQLDRQEAENIKRYVENTPIDPERKPCTYCRDYRLGYWVVWNGDMRFCSFMNEPNIPVNHMRFREAWEQLIRYEETLEWPAECKTCHVRTACFKCAGMLSAECGSPHKVNEEFCNRVKKFYDEKKGEWKL